jgi:DNA-binding transcriptional LysR family regulator
MDLRAVRYVVTLAEELHFGRAARRHYISEQPFGQRVKQLEREVGFALFERSSRRVSLTARGEVFVLRATEALRRFDELALESGTPGDDTLTVGVLGFGMAELWGEVRRSLEQEHPSVRLVHRDLDLVTQHRLVLSGEVDAGIVFDLGPVDGLVLDEIFDAPRVAVVPAWSELADRAFLSAVELEGQRWAPVSATNAQMVQWLGPAAADTTSVDAVRRPEAIASAVATTGALALHAAPAARFYPRPDVRYVPAEGPGCRIAVATREDDTRPAVQALRRAIAATLELRALG